MTAATPALGSCLVCGSPGPRLFCHVDGRTYWRCDACAATLLDPTMHPSPEAERAEYRLHRNNPHDPGYRRFVSRLGDPLLARLEGPRRGLDFGSGGGSALAAIFEESGHEVVPYDPFFADDPGALSERYDFILCSEVVEHFHDPAREFRRLDGLLEPGAWLGIMTCFQTDDEKFAGWHYRKDLTHVVFYREETLRFIANEHGWTCEIPRKDVALMRKPDRRPWRASARRSARQRRVSR
ncbi:class I SAM-dependent methyltransferase [Lutibaculum baratangense]|nr:class I SAM-dependent methyltransferase [Lutibaculum baratangense]